MVISQVIKSSTILLLFRFILFLVYWFEKYLVQLVSSVKVFVLRTVFFWTTLHGGKAMKNFQNPNSKSLYFHKHQSCGIKKVAMILPLSRRKFFVCCNQKTSASAVAKV
jgi:hypothetical protein